MKSRFGAIGCALKRANFRLVIGTSKSTSAVIYRMPDGIRKLLPHNRVGRLRVSKNGSVTLTDCTDPEVLIMFAIAGNS